MNSVLTRTLGALHPLHPTKGQTFRGVLMSVLVSMFLAYSEALLKKGGVPDDSVLMFHDMLIGSTLGFLADIVFGTTRGFCSMARGDTHKACVAEGAQQLKGPLEIALAEVGGMTFLKYVITVLIDLMISMMLFSQATSAGITDPMQKKALKMIIALVTFFLYANKTRFDFAYIRSDSATDFVMTVFLASVSMAFLSFPESEDPGLNSVFAPKSRLFIVIGAFVSMCMYMSFKGVRSGFLHNLFHGTPARKSMTGGLVLLCILGLSIFAMSKSAKKEHVESDPGYELTTGLMAAGAALAIAGIVFRIRKK